MKNNIKDILEKKGISIYRLSKDIGMSYSNTHDLVNRKNLDTTNLETIKKVAESLGVEMEELYR